jgi:hypothetical protein
MATGDRTKPNPNLPKWLAQEKIRREMQTFNAEQTRKSYAKRGK